VRLLSLAVATAVAACAGPGPVGAARESLAAMASAGAQADVAVSSAYSRGAAEATRRSATFEEYETRMARLSVAVAAVGTLHFALFAAEHAVDALEAGTGSAPDAALAMACVSSAVVKLVAAMEAAGVRVPAKAAKARATAEHAGARCAEAR
jgi:hypothetical protein